MDQHSEGIFLAPPLLSYAWSPGLRASIWSLCHSSILTRECTISDPGEEGIGKLFISALISLWTQVTWSLHLTGSGKHNLVCPQGAKPANLLSSTENYHGNYCSLTSFASSVSSQTSRIGNIVLEKPVICVIFNTLSLGVISIEVMLCFV